MALAMLALLVAYPVAAQEYVLSLEYETKSEGLGEYPSRSSSRGHQALKERIIGSTAAGTKIEYSVPSPEENASGNARWMFPVRLLVASDGTKTVLNESELAARLDAWLDEAEWSREVCERWFFTWIAAQVRCEPAAAIEAVGAFGLRPGPLVAGEEFALDGAAQPVVLRLVGTRDGHDLLAGSAPIDARYVREQQAQAAMVVAEISGKTLTAEAAAAQAASIEATGTVSVEFEIDEAGLVWRRTDKSNMDLTGGPYGDENRQSVHSVTRKLVSDQEDRADR